MLSQPDKIDVREYIPRSMHDSILSILRKIFVRSVDDYYKEIETQLQIESNKTLNQWLQETFDDIQNKLISKTFRCFILCSSDIVTHQETYGIIGFLTLKEEDKGSIYIAQCAIEVEQKRRGYGAQLLQHLRTVYPPGTYYWGLCRRANLPAVKFYLKQGAKLMDNEEIAEKYTYDPTLYTGFQFTDVMENLQSRNINQSNATSDFGTRHSHVMYQDESTMTDAFLDNQKEKRVKTCKCCVII